MRVEMFTFLVAAMICLGGALGVVLLRNTVHNALSLVATLFGIAVLFMAQGAYFLAAVQVIVYAGAIVILFLFVIMLLGVDRATKMGVDPIVGQRPAAVIAGLAILGMSLVALLAGPEVVTGASGTTAAVTSEVPDVNQLGRVLFTDYVFAFEITAILLTVAVVGAVVLVRRSAGEPEDSDEFPEGTAADELAAQRALEDEWDDDAAVDGPTGEDDLEPYAEEVEP
ncbi:MAG: NADH-quinone oxidoreductase subunit J [Microthrixaceae bacterium]|nr:NADH-quinone oxidoreductase subunit J [Microthrixaceae bacterium]